MDSMNILTLLDVARILRLDTQADAFRWCKAHGVPVDRPALALNTIRIDADAFTAALHRDRRTA